MSRVGEDRSKIRRPTLFESFVGFAIGIPNHLSKQIGNECSKLADGERFLSSGDSNDQLQHGNGDGPRRASTERRHLISNGWKTNGATKPTPRRPLSSDEDVKEQIRSSAGVPLFGLDVLSSAAYDPGAALTILIPRDLAGVAYTISIGLTVIVPLSIVYLSYRQTIAAYPTGGGSYIVASANLGQRVGVFAGAALMIDYILSVAVGISAGVGAMVSAIPSLEPA
jgi:hypothetical protein